jgi:hypothetical protein
MRYIKKIIQPKLQGQQPQEVTAFEFVPLSCSEIRLSRVCYYGEVKKHDAVYITYYKVLEAQKEQEKSPMMIEQ